MTELIIYIFLCPKIFSIYLLAIPIDRLSYWYWNQFEAVLQRNIFQNNDYFFIEEAYWFLMKFEEIHQPYVEFVSTYHYLEKNLLLIYRL